jgi:hypothetical protein
MLQIDSLRALAFIAALGAATPAAAADDAAELAESRLHGCLLAGSSAAPQTGLREAVVSVRSFCAPQIKRVRGYRVKVATSGLSGDPKKAAEDRAIRALNDEIALAIANFTGLTP